MVYAVVREADLGVDREGRKASWKHEMRERLMELRWAEQLLLANLALDHAPQRYPSLNSSTIVLRGEENTQHPVQVPLWSPGAPRLRQGSGLQKKSTGLKSTERQLLQQNCSKE